MQNKSHWKGQEMEESRFAPAYRVTKNVITRELQKIIDTDYVTTILNGLPYIAAILNQHRQVVFANNALLQRLNLQVLDQLLGDRPGEILHCVNSKKEIGGCGTSENCRYCGAVKTILKCQTESSVYTDECRIVSNNNGYIEAHDYKVTSSPLRLKDQQFIILTLLDISAEKRKIALEKIFFHDVINKAGTLQGFIELAKNARDEKKMKEMIDIMNEIASELTQEIMSQRELMHAENGELKVKISESSSNDIIQSISAQIQKHEVAKNRKVQIDNNMVSVIILTDVIILKRILLNMLKNALEATSDNGVVTIGFDNTNDFTRFWVHNESHIPRSTQLQIFQRSFSTKAANRGLGTYSMKLLGERYLKGKVYFQSSQDQGTTFFFELPK